MFFYNLYGLTIQSDIKIGHLCEAENENIDVVIRNENIADEIRSFIEKENGQECKHYIGKDYSCFMNSVGYFAIKKGNEILYDSNSESNSDKVIPFILGYGMAMLLLQRNTLAVHCGAITDGNFAYLISGFSGAGKSTITRKMLDNGYRLMEDDIAAVRLEDDQPVVYSAFPYQKLCRNELFKKGIDVEQLTLIDEGKEKYLLPVHDIFEYKPKKLKYMFVIYIGNVNEIVVERIKSLESLTIFKMNLFLGHLKGDWSRDEQFVSYCLKAISKCKIYVIVRPKNTDSTEEIVENIKKIIATT